MLLYTAALVILSDQACGCIEERQSTRLPGTSRNSGDHRMARVHPPFFLVPKFSH